MRYCNISALRPGMVVGEDVRDNSGEIFLKKHSRLTLDNISYLSFLGIHGIRIDESFSEAQEAKEISAPRVEEEALRTVKEFFRRADTYPLPETERKLEIIVTQIVQEVLSDPNVMKNLLTVRRYDDYTYCHSVNVGILAGLIGCRTGLKGSDIRNLVMGGFLHDVGKVFIDINIIHAPRRLTDEERIRMMAHPRLGYEFLVKNYHFSEPVMRSVLQHHEWYNGMGYPSGLSGEQILLNSRILKAADVYDAMTSTRPYHPAYLPSEVLEYIMGRSGMEFDPRIVEIMCRTFTVYPVGTEIELSDGRRAIVTENHEGYVLRPTVHTLKENQDINLQADRDARSLTIVKMML